MKRSTRIKLAEIQMRRAMVLRYHSLGYTAVKIAEICKVSDATVHLDIEALRKENRRNGADWLRDNLMHEYMKALSALDYLISEHKRVIDESKDIRELIASRTGLRESVMNKMQLIGQYEVTPSSSTEESSTTNEETQGDPTDEDEVIQVTQDSQGQTGDTSNSDGGQ